MDGTTTAVEYMNSLKNSIVSLPNCAERTGEEVSSCTGTCADASNFLNEDLLDADKHMEEDVRTLILRCIPLGLHQDPVDTGWSHLLRPFLQKIEKVFHSSL